MQPRFVLDKIERTRFQEQINLSGERHCVTGHFVCERYQPYCDAE